MKHNYFKIFILLLFLIFLITYISKESGYYEYENYKKSLITKEAINVFEKDIKEGKNVNNKDYLDNEYKDYSSNISNLGLKSSIIIDEIMNKGIGNFLKIIKLLF